MSLQALQTWADEHKIFSKDLRNETWLKQWDAPLSELPEAIGLLQGDEQIIARNAAFVLADAVQRQRFAQEYRRTAALYYQGQPDFELLVDRIHQHMEIMRLGADWSPFRFELVLGGGPQMLKRDAARVDEPCLSTLAHAWI